MLIDNTYIQKEIDKLHENILTDYGEKAINAVKNHIAVFNLQGTLLNDFIVVIKLAEESLVRRSDEAG